MGIREILENTVDKYREKIALIFKGEELTFQDLKDHVLKLASVLKDCGIKKGDKIAIYLPNGLEYVFSYLASFYLGAVVVPLDFMLKTEELLSCLEHSETKLLIANTKKDVSFVQIQEECENLDTIILCQGELPGALKYDELMADAITIVPQVEVNESDPALIMYTSGTTGQPKGILLNYKHLEGSPKAMEYFVDLSDKDIKLSALPFSHIGGFIYIQNCIFFGITLIIMERFNPFEFLENISRYKVTCFHVVPAMYTAILTLKHIERFNLDSLRWVVVFGAPSSPEIMKRFHQFCPNAKLLNGWGMTETCPPNTVTPLDSDRIASVGKPSPFCQIMILDEQGQELPEGEIGEIAISGWIVMEGYYKDPTGTEAIKRNGWLFTGDLGRFDQDGFLYIVGRKKEMIKVAGQIVYAPEVEAAFYKHQDVAEVAVIGIPDKMRGEAVKAFVVLKPGLSMSVDDLKFFAKDHLAHFKAPQLIEIRDELPKNRTGKIDKEALKNESLVISD